jgi:hypothetical protein
MTARRRSDLLGNVPGICWYLFGLSSVTAAIASAITVVPTSEYGRGILVASAAALASVFGVIASLCQWRSVCGPLWAIRILQLVAVIATIAFLFCVIG